MAATVATAAATTTTPRTLAVTVRCLPSFESSSAPSPQSPHAPPQAMSTATGSWTSVLAIYFLFFVFSAFILLPFGVRTHDEAGLEMVPGQADSAPAEFRGGRLLLRAAVLAAFVTTAYVLNYIYGWITVNDIMFWGPWAD